jgi:hypothetical protein
MEGIRWQWDLLRFGLPGPGRQPETCLGKPPVSADPVIVQVEEMILNGTYDLQVQLARLAAENAWLREELALYKGDPNEQA